MLVDAGPGSTLGGHGARVVEAALRARRREHIDVLLLSHPHPDHYGGMAELSELYPIRSFWSPQLIAPDQRGRPLQRWLALLEARGTLRRGPRQLCGASQRFGEARVDLLAPCPDVEMGANINDNSLVMRIRFGAQTALFMGDAEANEERRLLDQHEDLRSDFLKVGHHGSRTSSTQALLNAVRPRHAVVSCGARNRFGHPHPQTLRALSSVPTWRTDRWGAVLWQSNGHRAQWRPAR